MLNKVTNFEGDSTDNTGYVVRPFVTEVMTWQACTMAHGVNYRGLPSCNRVLQIPTRNKRGEFGRPRQPRGKRLIVDQEPSRKYSKKLYKKKDNPGQPWNNSIEAKTASSPWK